jgi:hypothetical protein
VKNGIRITGIVLISLLYCYSIGMVNGYSANSVSKKVVTAHQVIYSSPDSLSKLYDISQTKTSVNTFNNNLPSPIKNQFNEFWSVIKYAEQFVFNKITQHFITDSDFLIPFQKTDIIFPFNCFW